MKKQLSFVMNNMTPITLRELYCAQLVLSTSSFTRDLTDILMWMNLRKIALKKGPDSLLTSCKLERPVLHRQKTWAFRCELELETDVSLKTDQWKTNKINWCFLLEIRSRQLKSKQTSPLIRTTLWLETGNLTNIQYEIATDRSDL